MRDLVNNVKRVQPIVAQREIMRITKDSNRGCPLHKNDLSTSNLTLNTPPHPLDS